MTGHPHRTSLRRKSSRFVAAAGVLAATLAPTSAHAVADSDGAPAAGVECTGTSWGTIVTHGVDRPVGHGTTECVSEVFEVRVETEMLRNGGATDFDASSNAWSTSSGTSSVEGFCDFGQSSYEVRSTHIVTEEWGAEPRVFYTYSGTFGC